MAVAFTCTLPPQVENTGGTIIGMLESVKHWPLVFIPPSHGQVFDSNKPPYKYLSIA